MKRFGIAVLVCCSIGLAVPPAQATFPGAPGKIVFYTYDLPNRIVTINPDGSGRTALTGTDENAQTPEWSPNGLQIAFTSDFGRSRRVEIMDADGGNRSVVFDDQGRRFTSIGGVDWSPDGATLAICASRRTWFNYRILLVDIATGSRERIGLRGDCDPSWSPLGDKIAVTSFDPDIYRSSVATMAIDGSDRQVVAPRGFQPDWSPTGDRIVYANRDIFIVNADGSGRARFTKPTVRQEYTPTWAPDGSRIAFARAQGRSSLAQDDIFLQPLDSQQEVRVTETPADEFWLSWQPIVGP